MSIENKIQSFETIKCPKCKTCEMELHSNIWYCSECGYNVRHDETLNKKKYISNIKLKKYILNQFDDNTSQKIIAVYLKKKGYTHEIFNNYRLLNELLMDLKINTNYKTHKLFALENII